MTKSKVTVEIGMTFHARAWALPLDFIFMPGELIEIGFLCFFIDFWWRKEKKKGKPWLKD